MKSIIHLLLYITLFTSCEVSRLTGSPKPIKLVNEHALNGTYTTRASYIHNDGMGARYWRNYEDLTSWLNIKDPTEYVTLTFEDPRTLLVSYWANGERKEKRLEGKMKKKYFEIYHHKKRMIIPVIYSSVSISRIRLGKTEKGELYAHTYSEDSGNLLFLAGGAGSRSDVAYTDSINLSGLRPSIYNGQWGYTDASGTFVIPPIYEYASLFEKEVARVKKRGKWGVIDHHGKALTAYKYDEMMPLDTVRTPFISKVSIGEKYGAINMHGQEVIPVVYDQLGYYFRDEVVEIRQGEKWGVATRTGVLYQAVYDKRLNWGEVLFLWDNKKRERLTGAWAKKDGIEYLITDDGYEYDTVIVTHGLIKEKLKLVIQGSKRKSPYSTLNQNHPPK